MLRRILSCSFRSMYLINKPKDKKILNREIIKEKQEV